MIREILLLPPAMVGDHSKGWGRLHRQERFCNILHRDGKIWTETVVEATAMLVSAEPNLHSPFLGCYKIPLHFGLAETQYPMRRIDRSRGGVDLLLSGADVEEVCLASNHNPFDAENGGGRYYCKYSLFTMYGQAVTV
jgi:hypothetical protein